LTVYYYPFSLWFYAFLWTLALEWPVYTFVLWSSLGKTRRHVFVLFLINIATHPFLWYLFPRFQPTWLWIWVAEAWVTLTETLLLGLFLAPNAAQERLLEIHTTLSRTTHPPLSSFSPQQARWLLAFLAALFANTFSTLAGFLIF
jgi:hypothetical protein